MLGSFNTAMNFFRSMKGGDNHLNQLNALAVAIIDPLAVNNYRQILWTKVKGKAVL
jgi:hypothetical protein